MFDFKILQQGVNVESIEICKSYVKKEAALLCTKNTNFHSSFRSACLDFVVSAFIDCTVEENGVDIDNMWHCFVSIFNSSYF